MTDSGIKD